jgi:hypothetical protein
MSLTETQAREAARNLGKKMFANATATLDLDDLTAAVASIDTAMETVISSIPGAWSAKTIKQALLDNLPEPFQTTSTGPQKAFVLWIWAAKEAGVI